ncbi:MAG: hypothetical protein ACLS89_02225 [Collinsella sp.]
MPNVSNEERLAVITAFGKAVKQAEKQVREEVDAQMREDFMVNGVTQKQLTVNGQKVGTISARMTKEKVGKDPMISSLPEFVEWPYIRWRLGYAEPPCDRQARFGS